MKELIVLVVGVFIGLAQTKFQSDNICLAQPNGASFVISEDCSTYVVCEYNQITVMQCDKGLLYDSKLSVCNWASQVQCGQTALDPKTTTVPQTTTTPFPSSTRPPFPSSTTPSFPSPTTPSFPSSTTASLTTPSNVYPSCANSGFYFLPHETNCEFYYICAFGATLKHNCGPGIHWSAESNQCDYPERARCRQSTPATSPTTTTVNTTTKPEYAAPVLPPRCAGDKIFYPCLTDCTKYYICIGVSPIVMTCPQNYAWNADISQCDSPANVTCAKSYH